MTDLSVIKCKFEYGSSTRGSGIYIENGGTDLNLTVMNSVFTSNLAMNKGGGIYVYGLGVYIYNTTFRNNIAKDTGSDIYFE